jgi:hypothetical protein
MHFLIYLNNFYKLFCITKSYHVLALLRNNIILIIDIKIFINYTYLNILKIKVIIFYIFLEFSF